MPEWSDSPCPREPGLFPRGSEERCPPYWARCSHTDASARQGDPSGAQVRGLDPLAPRAVLSAVGSEGKSDSPVSPKEKMGSKAAPVARLVTSKQPAAGSCPAIRSTTRHRYLIHGSDALAAVAQRGRVHCRPCRMLGFTMHGASRPRRATVLDQPCDATGCTGLMREV